MPISTIHLTESATLKSLPLFQMMTLEKYLTNFFIFLLGGTPILAPLSAASPKMAIPVRPMTPLFYCRILFYSENVDVCKKIELNPLRFDRDLRV